MYVNVGVPGQQSIDEVRPVIDSIRSARYQIRRVERAAGEHLATVSRGEEWVVHVVEEQNYRSILSGWPDMDVCHCDVGYVANGYSELYCGSIVYQPNICTSKRIGSYGGVLLSTDQPDVEGHSRLLLVVRNLVIVLMLLMVIRQLVVLAG